jgi:hypothetical protein
MESFNIFEGVVMGLIEESKTANKETVSKKE